MSRKKVIVRRFIPGLLHGYLAPAEFVSESALELLDLSGRVLSIPLSDVKMVSFVREFNVADQINPERLARKTFVSRPRTEGLWLRMSLQDEDVLEGLAPLDLTLLESISDDLGIQITPPDIRGNVQRIYVPRLAIASLQLLAVITTPSRRKRAVSPEEAQNDLFDGMISTRLH